MRWLILTQVNGLKTTTDVTDYVFILQVLGYLTLMLMVVLILSMELYW